MTRFLGYNDNPQDIRWPGDAGMAVSVVLNIEEGAELSINDGDESNESVHEVTQPVHGAPDLASHRTSNTVRAQATVESLTWPRPPASP